jgi:hypothetical protein
MDYVIGFFMFGIWLVVFTDHVRSGRNDFNNRKDN